jgi:hypothetical protein
MPDAPSTPIPPVTEESSKTKRRVIDEVELELETNLKRKPLPSHGNPLKE